MDRTRAQSTIGSALLTAAIPVAVFGLCFWVAIVYIG
jgi:hypothetical protein